MKFRNRRPSAPERIYGLTIPGLGRIAPGIKVETAAGDGEILELYSNGIAVIYLDGNEEPVSIKSIKRIIPETAKVS